MIDTCGFPKDTFFYYKSWWKSEPVLHVFPHWNWPGYEGKEIAVWVHSNLESVELLLNGASLGKKDVNKDSHVAWKVTYTPGTIEAHGYKDGKQTMTAKRETTGVPAKLVLAADRTEVAADGEDVAMFAVSVLDAQGRLVPVTENDVTFRITGAGKLIGTGNGDPTNQQPDKGSSRKAFGGLCMGLVQATKKAGSITVEVTSPGLKSASATIVSKATKLRPQVPVFEREVPTGSGVTGLWRPEPAADGGSELLSFLGVGGNMVFTLREEGSSLTGFVEGGGSGFLGGGDVPTPIQDGKVAGESVSFKAGTSTYVGARKGDKIELTQTTKFPFGIPEVAKESLDRPAIGPPPDGSDPSINFGGRGFGAGFPIVLRRVKR